MKEILKKRTKSIALMVWQNCQKTGNELLDWCFEKLKDDFNEEFFTKIDIREVTQIPIPGTKKATVVSTHGSESYKITGEGDARILEIMNIEEFWKSSKYLVIIID